MRIVRVFIDEFSPEDGPPGQRLFVLLANGRYESILIDQPQDVGFFVSALLELSERLVRSSREAKVKDNGSL